MAGLENYRVGDLPAVYYIRDAVSTAEEEQLLTQLRSSKQAWKTVSGRKLQNLGGMVHKKGLIPAPMPSWLQPLLSRLAADTALWGEGQLPNHVLINAYQPGEGIMPHEDGPLYLPAVAILSLGAPAVVRFAKKRSSEAEAEPTDAAAAAEGAAEPHHFAAQLVASVVCQPRSLLIFREKAYTDCLHGILEAESESIDSSVVNAEQAGVQIGQQLPRSGERISLTVRRVLRTYSVGIRL